MARGRGSRRGRDRSSNQQTPPVPQVEGGGEPSRNSPDEEERLERARQEAAAELPVARRGLRRSTAVRGRSSSGSSLAHRSSGSSPIPSSPTYPPPLPPVSPSHPRPLRPVTQLLGAKLEQDYFSVPVASGSRDLTTPEKRPAVVNEKAEFQTPSHDGRSYDLRGTGNPLESPYSIDLTASAEDRTTYSLMNIAKSSPEAFGVPTPTSSSRKPLSRAVTAPVNSENVLKVEKNRTSHKKKVSFAEDTINFIKKGKGKQRSVDSFGDLPSVPEYNPHTVELSEKAKGKQRATDPFDYSPTLPTLPNFVPFGTETGRPFNPFGIPSDISFDPDTFEAPASPTLRKKPSFFDFGKGKQQVLSQSSSAGQNSPNSPLSPTTHQRSTSIESSNFSRPNIFRNKTAPSTSPKTSLSITSQQQVKPERSVQIQSQEIQTKTTIPIKRRRSQALSNNPVDLRKLLTTFPPVGKKPQLILRPKSRVRRPQPVLVPTGPAKRLARNILVDMFKRRSPEAGARLRTPLPRRLLSALGLSRKTGADDSEADVLTPLTPLPDHEYIALPTPAMFRRRGELPGVGMSTAQYASQQLGRFVSEEEAKLPHIKGIYSIGGYGHGIKSWALDMFNNQFKYKPEQYKQWSIGMWCIQNEQVFGHTYDDSYVEGVCFDDQFERVLPFTDPKPIVRSRSLPDLRGTQEISAFIPITEFMSHPPAEKDYKPFGLRPQAGSYASNHKVMKHMKMTRRQVLNWDTESGRSYLERTGQMKEFDSEIDISRFFPESDSGSSMSSFGLDMTAEERAELETGLEGIMEEHKLKEGSS